MNKKINICDANSKIVNFSAVWMQYKRRGLQNHTSPCSAISPALTKQHSLLKVLGPSRQHYHVVSVHPTLTSSHLNTRRKLAALSLSLVN